MRGLHSDAPGPAIRPQTWRYVDDRPNAPIMVQKDGGEELGAFHYSQRSNGYVVEFHFNLADVHLGRFAPVVIQNAVRGAIGSAFFTHTVSVIRFSARQPFVAKFTVMPSSGGSFVRISECVGALADRLDALLRAAPKLPKANPAQQ
jgi:hypothetical protein